MAQRQTTLLAVILYMKITLLVTVCPSSFFIFSTEFYAIEKVLEIIASHHHENFIIYTESKSVLEEPHSYSCSPTYSLVLEHYNELL